MKIIIASPLFPPDIGGASGYAKELSRRLARNHAVTVLTYGYLPEEVADASVIGIDKRAPLFMRLLRYTYALWRQTKEADILFAENGSSVELPAGIVARMRRLPLIVHIGDAAAHEHAASSWTRRLIEHFAFKRAHSIISARPRKRPEILPFKPYPSEEFAAYEQSWNEHLKMLTTIFSHAR